MVFHIELTERILKGENLKELANENNISTTAIVSKVRRTLRNLSEFYDFHKKEIPYPNPFYYKKDQGFWLGIISDYKEGVESYKRPEPLLDTRLISELTISEFKELINDLRL